MALGESRLLLQEILVPETKAGLEACWLDITMMAMGGRQRTEKDWVRLSQSAGLRFSKTYHVAGTNNTVIEILREE